MNKVEKQDALVKLAEEYSGAAYSHATLVGMAFALLDENQIDKMISYLEEWIGNKTK